MKINRTFRQLARLLGAQEDAANLAATGPRVDLDRVQLGVQLDVRETAWGGLRTAAFVSGTSRPAPIAAFAGIFLKCNRLTWIDFIHMRSNPAVANATFTAAITTFATWAPATVPNQGVLGATLRFEDGVTAPANEPFEYDTALPLAGALIFPQTVGNPIDTSRWSWVVAPGNVFALMSNNSNVNVEFMIGWREAARDVDRFSGRTIAQLL